MASLKIDVAVIGAMKSASTTVTDFLRQHPDVFVPAHKTLNYFSYGMIGETLSESAILDATASQQAVRTRDEYEKHFSDASPGQLLCDCSDSYYFYPGTAERLHAHNPDMKIVLVMREPVSRAYSSFNHARSHLLETTDDFEEVFARSRQEEESLLPIRRYKTLSLYGELIAPFVELFGKERIHLVGLDEIMEDYHGTLSRLVDFLGISSFEGEKLWSNPTFVPPSGVSGKIIGSLKKPARWVLRRSSGSKQSKEIVKFLMKRIYKRPASLPDDVRERMKRDFSGDISRLEGIFGSGFYSKWS